MDAIDTQELIEFLTKGSKSDAVEKLFKEVERKKSKLFVSNYTILELAYLLEHAYGVEKQLVIKSLRTILEDPIFKVEARKELEEALRLYAQGLSFLDALKEVQYGKNRARRVRL
ncbi:MAG: hypothetical protein D6699_07255 [Aquificota bacterium]|nr:MAG: hypothetical protein D6699_07255 [Aquificota bacterium]